MNRYLLTKLVSSTVSFWTLLAIRGLTFTQATDSSALVSGEETAESWQVAMRSFEQRLFIVLDAMAVELLAAVSSHEAPTLVDRLDSDAALLIMISRIERQGLIPPYREQGVAELDRVATTLGADEGLRRAAASFRESLNNQYASEVVIHLLRCAEGLAGRKMLPVTCRECSGTMACKSCSAEPEGRPATDPDSLKRILGKDLYKTFFRYPGIRHNLMHGMPITNEIAAQADFLRAAVVEEFKARLNLTEQPPYGKAIPRYLFSTGGIFIEKEEPMPSHVELVKFAPQEYLDGKSIARWVGHERQAELQTSY